MFRVVCCALCYLLRFCAQGKRQAKYLHIALVLLDDIIALLCHPGVVHVCLAQEQLAEEHEAATLAVGDGHFRVLREILPGPLGKRMTLRRTEEREERRREEGKGAYRNER